MTAADDEAPDRDSFLREGLLAAYPPAPVGAGQVAASDGGRVRITFARTEGEPDREVRVPSGVSVFDAASWAAYLQSGASWAQASWSDASWAEASWNARCRLMRRCPATH